MIQHVIRSVDENIRWLADAYGVSPDSIATANGFDLSMASIYGWLSTHGGTRQTADPEAPTGYHWSFSPGMVVNISHPGPSLSPPIGDPGETPGGPVVAIGEEEPPPLVPITKAAFGGPLMWLLIAGVLYVMFSKPAPKRRKKRAKRKTTRRRRRR